VSLEPVLVSRLLVVVLVLGLLALCLFLLGRYRDRYLYGSQATNPAIKVSGELNLGIRQRVVLLHVEGRSLVLAVMADKVEVLAEWPVPEHKNGT
jgi:flagellar biogenesis protein FliO